MTSGMFVWQSSNLAEKNIQEMCATLKTGRVQELRPKIWDDIYWMGDIDTQGFFQVHNSLDYQKLAENILENNLFSAPWGVVKGSDQEKNLIISLGKISPRIIFDLEPGPQYWADINTASGIARGVRFFSSLRQALPDNWLVLSIPGSWAWSQLDPMLTSIAPYVDCIEIQSYWTPEQALHDENHVKALLGPVQVSHACMYGMIPSMAGWAESVGHQDFAVWDFAHMTQDLYKTLSLHSFPAPENPRGETPVPVFSVGQGILDAMHAHNDTPATNEMYPAGLLFSYAVGSSGRIYFYSADARKVSVTEPA